MLLIFQQKPYYEKLTSKLLKADVLEKNDKKGSNSLYYLLLMTLQRQSVPHIRHIAPILINRDEAVRFQVYPSVNFFRCLF